MIINLQKYALRSCLLIALLLGACAPPQVAQPLPEPIELKVLLLPYLSFAPLFIAEEEGYFAKQGLQVEFVRLERSAEAIPALAQSELDVAAGFVNVGTLNALARGISIKLVAGKGYIAPSGCPANAFLARRELVEDGELDRSAQLEGRRIALNLVSPRDITWTNC